VTARGTVGEDGAIKGEFDVDLEQIEREAAGSESSSDQEAVRSRFSGNFRLQNFEGARAG
jgi:hypothetical protein